MQYAFRYLAPVALIALATGIVALVRLAAPVDNTAMLYLFAVLASAVLFGSRTAILTAVASFIAFNFFFVQPRHTFTVAHEDEWVALALLLVTGIITGQLAAELRDRARRAEQREREAVVLYDTVRLLSDPAVPGALQRLAERLRAELQPDAVSITLGQPLNVNVTAGDPEIAGAAGLSPRILSAGTPPTEHSPARPGRWIKLVAPVRSFTAGSASARTIAVRAGEDANAGSISLVFKAGGRNPTSIDDRLLSAVAHQLGQALERLRLQREATDAEVLRRTDEVRAALLNAVSHDLRTPLTSIIATGDNLLSRDLEWTEEERRSFVAAMVGEANRLNRLVGGLLDLSRIEAGSLIPSRALHDLTALINEAVGRTEAAYPTAEFIIEIASDLPPVPLDYVEIEQVLANLLENAVLHGSPPVRISATQDHDQVRISIEDSGAGIPEAHLESIFQPFSSSSPTHAGAGLGLAIARGFVAAHGGRIWAENLRRGARFTFTLPLVPAGAQAPVT